VALINVCQLLQISSTRVHTVIAQSEDASTHCLVCWYSLWHAASVVTGWHAVASAANCYCHQYQQQGFRLAFC
jgi:hypothetical protein